MENKCQAPHCNHTARYYDRSNDRRNCKEHKTVSSFNFKDYKCVVEGCNGWQVYNFIGGRGLFCIKHKCAGMANVNKIFKHSMCFILNCSNMCRPALPVCKEHSPKKMYNISRPKIREEDLPAFYEKQRLEAMKRLKFMLKIEDDLIMDGRLLLCCLI